MINTIMMVAECRTSWNMNFSLLKSSWPEHTFQFNRINVVFFTATLYAVLMYFPYSKCLEFETQQVVQLD